MTIFYINKWDDYIKACVYLSESQKKNPTTALKKKEGKGYSLKMGISNEIIKYWKGKGF